MLELADVRERAWILLGLYAGLRRFEIAKLRGAEVTRSHIMLVGKGGQAEMIPTHPVLWELAQLYPSTGYWFTDEDGQPITPGKIDRDIAKLYRALGIRGNIHRTRATYGTRLARAGAHIKIVQELMRHRSMASTEHYIAAAADEVGAAIRLLPPLTAPGEASAGLQAGRCPTCGDAAA
jgi:integrase